MKLLTIDMFRPGDRLKYNYGKRNSNNYSAIFLGIVDEHCAVLKRWNRSKQRWDYETIPFFDQHLRIHRGHVWLKKKVDKWVRNG